MSACSGRNESKPQFSNAGTLVAYPERETSGSRLTSPRWFAISTTTRPHGSRTGCSWGFGTRSLCPTSRTARCLAADSTHAMCKSPRSLSDLIAPR